MNLSFSVVTYNNEECIERLLLSIIRSVGDFNNNYKIFVVDNNSMDKTIQIVEKIQNPNISIIKNDKNVGFGAAHNIVLDKLDSDIHIIINPDIIIKDYFFVELIEFFFQNPDVCLVSPKVLNMDGTVQILPKRNPKLIYLLSRRLRFGFLAKYKDEYEMKGNNPDETFEIEFATGCFMSVRTTVLKQVAGFDSRYFMYCEDADLSRKLTLDYKVVYNPSFVVYHDWNRESKRNLKHFFIHVSSVMKYVRKWRKIERNGKI